MREGKRRPGWIIGVYLTGLITALVASCRSDSKPQLARVAETTRPSTQPAAAEGQPKILTKADMPALGLHYDPAPPERSADELTRLNQNCVACHTYAEAHTTMHKNAKVACVDCHGGNALVERQPVPLGIAKSDASYIRLKLAYHVTPKIPELWKNGANPVAQGAQPLKESLDFIRFVNPGDLLVARAACYNCHQSEVERVPKSMMAHGAMLWEAALYNNGSIRSKRPIYAESYAFDPKLNRVVPRLILQMPPPTTQQTKQHGILPFLYPLPRWEITQPGNILRVFERGGRLRPDIGIPNSVDDPGKPDVKLSIRGFGTDVRTDPVFIGLQKTRLLDPTLNFFGSNDHPGDFRSSGCTACHVVYANDRSPVHSAMWARFGNRGLSWSEDHAINPNAPATTQPSTRPIKGNEPGHPIQHLFVRQMPSSTCIVCHIHPGTNVVNSFLGYQWWDNETDGEFMYPRRQRYPTSDDEYNVYQHNPEGASVRGLWSNLYPGEESHAGEKAPRDFLEHVSELNDRLKHTQFADFHGHGWIFRAVYKQDRRGNLLDANDQPVQNVNVSKLSQGVAYQWHKPGDAPAAGMPVHLKDIHLEMGMQCVDCHFQDDAHGNGNLYGETRNATVVDCVDCHGSVTEPANILKYINDKKNRKENRDALVNAFTGNAATQPTEAQLTERSSFIRDRFDSDEGRLTQKSAMASQDSEAAKAAGVPEGWTVIQANETVYPLDSDKPWTKGASFARTDDKDVPIKRARLARYAHTIRKDGRTWGDVPARDNKDPAKELAHSSNMACYACHTSWNTSCFGCHLPMRANQRRQSLHNEGTFTRNYTNYNYQTLRDDVYMLGIDSTVKDHRIVPVRSACAVVVSSQDASRQWIYAQQQTVSAEGFAGTSFSPYFPHTVRATETKRCTDCHVSSSGDNNAIMAQLLLQGTNSVNFIGRFAWVGCGREGLQAVAVTERDEPQAVIGSRLHQLAFPDFAKEHEARGGKLLEGYSHEGDILDLQLRGEYVYAACGKEGFIAYDVANIDNKGFSERIITAPVSPLGQRFYVKTRYATSICSPSTLAIDPTRMRFPDNEEGAIHPLYAFLYLTDKYEGLVVIGNPWDEKKNKPGVATLLDGDPDNNFLKRAATYNPDGLLNGARHMALWGTKAFVSCDRGVVVLEMENPLSPRVLTVVGSNVVNQPRRTTFQFRYAFVCDADGVKVIDIEELLGLVKPQPGRPTPLKAIVRIADARDLYISRAYGYVAAGADGLLVLDLTNPEVPRFDGGYTTDASGNDATAVRVGMTNSSQFAYIADGRNGLKVFQLTSANDTPGFFGFAPRPVPRMIAWYPTRGPAIALSEGVDRDRAVDEAGNQLSVFGRRGARPFNLQEQERLYLKTAADGTRHIFTVSDEPTTDPLQPATRPSEAKPAEPPKRGGVPGRRPPGRR